MRVENYMTNCDEEEPVHSLKQIETSSFLLALNIFKISAVTPLLGRDKGRINNRLTFS